MGFNEKMTNLADAIREKTNQTESLSLDEMADSVRSIETGGGVPVTTEYVYEYSGDMEDSTLSWIYSSSGIKVFVKAGEIPNGTINYVGSTINRKHSNNQWLDRTFTVTEELLAMTVNRGIDINAKQNGMVQIFSKESQDADYFTAICICTKPGKYNIVFQDWYEAIQFDQTGVYFYDNREYGGKEYVQSFLFSATVDPSNPDNDIESTPIAYTGNEIQIFSRGICIGDSITDGTFNNNQSTTVIRKHSYPSVLKRLTGIDIANAGISGATSQSWYEATLNSDSQWGKWVNQEWVWNTNPTNSGNDIISSTLDYSGFDFAIIHLGINDLAAVYGDNQPIETVLANYETYINKIINKLKESNKGIKIFFATIIPSYAKDGNVVYEQLNNKIKEMSENLENVYLLDLNEYSEIDSNPAYNQSHPTALGYQKMASEIKSLISYIIKNNLSEFNSVQFIGTDYTL